MRRPIECLLLALSVVHLLGFAAVALLRIDHPFELEWLEGGSVDHVRRILAGKRLYVEPSIDFVPFVYTPLWFWLGAGLSQVLGVGYLPLRGLSLLAVLGCAAVLFVWVRKETADWRSGLVAAGLFAATYRASGAWFDLARVDSLFLLLLLAGLAVLRFGRSLGAAALGGALLSLAFLTKQVALVAALPAVLVHAWRRPRAGVVLGATLLLGIGGASLWLDRVHDGWFSYYAFELPSRHALDQTRWLSFWTADILWPLGIAMALAVLLFARRCFADRDAVLNYAATAAGLFTAAWGARVHTGGHDNVLQPAHAGLALLAGLAAAWLPRSWPRGSWVGAALVLQLAWLAYDPRPLLPSAADRRAGEELRVMIAGLPGDVLVAAHGDLTAPLGKRSFAHAMAVGDVLRAGETRGRAPLLASIQDALARRRFGGVIVDGPWFPELERFYAPSRRVFADPDVFFPVCGLRRRPEVLYLPRR